LAQAAIKVTIPENIVVSCKSAKHTAEVSQKIGCASGDAAGIAGNSRYIFLGVKPQSFPDLFSEIAEVLEKREDKFTLVTMAAGITMEKITELCGKRYPIIRIMPNTPVAVEAGCILYASNELVTREEEVELFYIMSAAGKFIKMDESLIDAAGCISGCGPAFVYKFIIALSKAGENCGIPADIAMELAEQTALGAAKLALVSGEAPEKLCRDVCSPGGTTIEGVKVMENSDLDKIISDTVLASYKRTKELSGN
jgi:pyrroline-5-carboxylate reductase